MKGVSLAWKEFSILVGSFPSLNGVFLPGREFHISEGSFPSPSLKSFPSLKGVSHPWREFPFPVWSFPSLKGVSLPCMEFHIPEGSFPSQYGVSHPWREFLIWRKFPIPEGFFFFFIYEGSNSPAAWALLITWAKSLWNLLCVKQEPTSINGYL